MRVKVIFYSLEGNSKLIAEEVAKSLNGDIVELKPKKHYANSGFKKYLWGGVYFVDMDGDNKSEMILPYGTCEADATAYVYKYKSGKAVKVGKFSYGHKMLVNYPGHKGLICMHAHMGYEEISVVYLKNGKVKSTSYGERNVGMGDYLSLKPLNNHLKSGKWCL